jgi:hypothetical protein
MLFFAFLLKKKGLYIFKKIITKIICLLTEDLIIFFFYMILILNIVGLIFTNFLNCYCNFLNFILLYKTKQKIYDLITLLKFNFLLIKSLL